MKMRSCYDAGWIGPNGHISPYHGGQPESRASITIEERSYDPILYTIEDGVKYTYYRQGRLGFAPSQED